MATAGSQAVSLSHYSPGRLRLKAITLRHDRALAERIRGTLESLPGIKAVTVKTLTGSLLIEFSPQELRSPEASRKLVAALAELFPTAFDDDCIRVNIAGLKGREEISLQLQEKLGDVAAIRSVNVDRGELRVEYDPETLNIPLVLDSLAS